MCDWFEAYRAKVSLISSRKRRAYICDYEQRRLQICMPLAVNVSLKDLNNPVAHRIDPPDVTMLFRSHPITIPGPIVVTQASSKLSPSCVENYR